MPEKFLNGAQIGTVAQKVGGETVAQRMRRGAVRQTEHLPEFPHLFLDDGGLQNATAGTTEQGLVTRDVMGAGDQIVGDCRIDCRNDRHQPHLAALARHPNAIADRAGNGTGTGVMRS